MSTQITSEPIKSYYAAGAEFFYPGAGDPKPPSSRAKVQLLTKGGICVQGQWEDNSDCVAWAPLPKRNRDKEELIGMHLR